MEALLARPVVQHHVGASGHGDDQLVECLVPVPTPLSSTGYVIEVVHTLDVERDMSATLDEGQVSPRAGDLGGVR